MAEPLGIVASCVTVVQLLGCVQHLQTFCRAVRDVPKSLKETLDELEDLRKIISEMGKIAAADQNLVSRSSILRPSLDRCEAATTALEALTSRIMKPLNTKSKLRLGHLLKAVLRKEEIKELKEKMDSAKCTLLMAITCYYNMRLEESHRVQQELLQLLKNTAPLPCITAEASTKEQDLAPVTNKRPKRLVEKNSQLYQERLCRLKRCCCACHDTMSLQTRFWPLKFSCSSWIWKACNKLSCRNTRKASIWISLTQIGIGIAVCISLDVRFSFQESNISPSLSFPRVVRRTSPGFKLLWELQTGQNQDWARARQDLLELFKSGKASPQDIDPDGRTWLEKLLQVPWYCADKEIQFSLFYMLADQGTQINTQRLLHQSVNWIGEGPHMALLDDLLYFGFDASEIEAPSFALWPQPCSPDWYAAGIVPDPFFIEWISKNLEVCPGFAGMSPLLEAILIESSDGIRKRLEKFPIEDQDNLLCLSPLHLAVFRPQHLEVLLGAGADVDARDRHGITPLMYATATGSTKIAIRLLDAGADFSVVDTLWQQNFLNYARDRGHWKTILDILDYMRQIPNIPKDVLCSWLGFGLFLWVSGNHINTDINDPNYFQQLLDWGADTNGINHYNSETLAHKVENALELKSLISHGFTNFNHPDNTGAHALISLSTARFENPHPDIIEMLLNGGSTVNHRNHEGQTSLHVVIQQLRAFHGGYGTERDWHSQKLSQISTSIRVLLNRKADPCIGDCCKCYCSRLGCTPSNVLLKGRHHSFLKPANNIWAFEYLDIVKETSGLETVKACLLDILRLIKFHDLELTHTCRHAVWRDIEDEEIEEIHREEMEMIEILENEMRTVERSLGDDFEEQLMIAFSVLLINAKADSRDKSSNLRVDDTNERYRIDQWRDEFVEVFPVPDSSLSKRMNTIELSGYADWVEYEHSKNQKEKKPDDKWYEKRIGWISRLRTIEEEAQRRSEEPPIPDQPLLLINSM